MNIDFKSAFLFTRPFIVSLSLGALIYAETPTEELLTSQGATWGFLGDSITHMGTYTEAVQSFLSTRYPGRDIWTVNLGRSGDTSWGAVSQRLERELSSEEFEVIFIHFGMNDVGGVLFGKNGVPGDENPKVLERRSLYVENMRRIIEAVLAEGAVPVLLSPTYHDYKWLNGRGDAWFHSYWNDELKNFAKLGAQLAEEYELLYIDWMTPLESLSDRMQAEDPSFTLIGPDRIHPKKGGDGVMANVLLQQLPLNPLVFKVGLSAKGKVTASENAEVQQLLYQDDTLSFNLTEQALPFPYIERDAGLLLTNFDKQLNQQIIQVRDLEVGKWALEIDGVPVGNYTAEELHVGVNLAQNSKTPQNQQARELRDLLSGEPATWFDGKDKNLKFREISKPEKEIYEQLIRTLQPWILNRDSIRLENEVSAEEWAIQSQDVIDEMNAKLKADEIRKGKALGGWPAFVARVTNEHLIHLYEYRDELRKIRKNLAAFPPQVQRTYVFRKVDP